ncbi:beta-lactamase superfamily domain-containing protein [Ampelomyces quisqualis]|uniref:Beta-lactamase superfamily domain-containing protein n=1 Tax=Ampelomyces quisqualis TaxID=50730 RepID=A0A6A5R0Q8_AMPQU|nr:beta-lactamase superfamily domain-containing protein [Ampelomyces quisqualis]
MSSIGGAGVGAGMYAVVSNPAQLAAQPEDAKDKAHHLKNGKGFTNPWDSYVENSAFFVFRTLLWRKITGQTKVPDTSLSTVPVCTPSLHPTRDTPKLRATWLGHACFYVEFPSGLRVLFDPVFEDCCAPIQLKSLKRFTPPPCEIEDLPFVDAVVISHNHYDHLSYPTTLRIKNHFPDAIFFAPLGNRKWFLDAGVDEDKVVELDWWESRDITLSMKTQGSSSNAGGKPMQANKSHTDITATLSALPCQHISARTPFDKCSSLWASWSVESHGANIWFAGDTGYRTVPRTPSSPARPACPAFAQIGALRGPFDLGLIPIGAYEPRWLWSAVHADPHDAVSIFLDTRCRTALGIHWGTWVLTEEDVLAPQRALEEVCQERGVREFGVCGVGEGREVDVCEGEGDRQVQGEGEEGTG